MTSTRAAVAAAIAGILLAGGLAAGGELTGPAPRSSDRDSLPTDAKSLATMYRKTVDGYRGLAAGYIFQTHLGIGMVAELAANKVYSADQATTTLDRMTGGMVAMRQLLKAVVGLKLPESDRQTVLTILKLTAQVDAEAKALSKYLLSSDQDDAAAYHKVRSQTAEAISKFLGIG